MSGPLSVPFAIAAVFAPKWTRVLLLALAGTCIIAASFRVFQKMYAELISRIAALEGEIRQLRVRPYDSAQLDLVRGRLAKLGSDERDLLRYLVEFGEQEHMKLFMECGMPEHEFGQIFDKVVRTNLLTREEQPRPGRSGTTLHFRVNTQFETILRDELFPRHETASRRCFSGGAVPIPTERIDGRITEAKCSDCGDSLDLGNDIGSREEQLEKMRRFLANTKKPSTSAWRPGPARPIPLGALARHTSTTRPL